MTDRKIEERFDTPDVKGEWEPCTRVKVVDLGDVKAWVRAANKKARLDGEFVRFRSIPDDSGDTW